MAKPLSWNTPAWNAPGVLWNGVEPTKKTMSNVKAIIDFSSFSADDLGTLAQSIHDGMTAAAATFTTPPVTMTALQSSIDNFESKLAARTSGATADNLAFTVARDELEGQLADLGAYVNIVANGNPVVVDASHIPSYSTSHPPDTSAPAAPANVRLRQGDLSGSVVARYKPARNNSMNQVETCIGDPNLEANWKEAGLFGGGKATISGIVPGTTIWLRARTVGLKGIMGAWSDPAKIMVV